MSKTFFDSKMDIIINTYCKKYYPEMMSKMKICENNVLLNEKQIEEKHKKLSKDWFNQNKILDKHNEERERFLAFLAGFGVGYWNHKSKGGK